jgi:hypothetical protein
VEKLQLRDQTAITTFLFIQRVGYTGPLRDSILKASILMIKKLAPQRG